MPGKPSMFAPLTPDEIGTALPSDRPPPDKKPIIPVPADAPAMTFKHPKHGAPSRSWPYHDAEGNLDGYMARFDFVGEDGSKGKEMLPITYCQLKNGRCGWRAKGIPAPRPLYRLPDIVSRKDARVIVCEGEKAADAAAALFPDCVATTPMGGAKAPHLTDWTALAGRQVFIARDNDEAGRVFADGVAGLLRQAGAHPGDVMFPAHCVVQDRQVVGRTGDIPDGWDLADAVDLDGWTPEIVEAECGNGTSFFSGGYTTAADVASFDAEQAALQSRAEERKAESEAALKQRFRAVQHGIEKCVETKDGTEWCWFCSPLEIEAVTRDSNGEEWGRLLVVTDRDGRRHPWAMPMAMLAGDGTIYREKLLSLGLELAPSKFGKDALHDYISTMRVQERARCVPRVGWHGRVFVLPNESYGAKTDERVLLQSSGDHAFRISGTLDEWQKEIAGYACGNSRLAFSIAAAFAAPLVALVSGESGGFHFRGSSSIGKSTALSVAASVWGGGGVKGYIKQWRATDNGLEAVAANHCDTLLCLDELSQIDAKAAGAAAYMLANGAGKSRSGRGGEARPTHEWRALFLSNGEIHVPAASGASAGAGVFWSASAVL